MGYRCHHAIVVTSWGALDKAHEKAVSLFGISSQVTPIVGPVINGYTSFMIGPDGSKEGWEPSNVGDLKRDAFCAWLDEQAYEDGSSCFQWAEVQYGDDNDDNRVLRTDADLFQKIQEQERREEEVKPGTVWLSDDLGIQAKVLSVTDEGVTYWGYSVEGSLMCSNTEPVSLSTFAEMFPTRYRKS